MLTFADLCPTFLRRLGWPGRLVHRRLRIVQTVVGLRREIVFLSSTPRRVLTIPDDFCR